MSALHILPDGGASGLDLFLAPAVTDFPFTALVRTMHHREAAHIKTAASPVTACRTLLARCHFFSSPSAGLNFASPRLQGKGRVIFCQQTDTDRERVDTPALLSLPVHFPTPLFCFLYHFNVSLWHIAASQPAGPAGRRRLVAKGRGL